jgi:hypothetical protein
MSDKVWVSTTSHRSRDRLRRLVGDTGPSYGVWPEKGGPHGDYYEVDAKHAASVGRIPGARVLRAAPSGGRVFKRWGAAEMGGPERGNWPVPEKQA